MSKQYNNSRSPVVIKSALIVVAIMVVITTLIMTVAGRQQSIKYREKAESRLQDIQRISKECDITFMRLREAVDKYDVKESPLYIEFIRSRNSIPLITLTSQHQGLRSDKYVNFLLTQYVGLQASISLGVTDYNNLVVNYNTTIRGWPTCILGMDRMERITESDTHTEN